MASILAEWAALQAGAKWWSGAGILFVALVICCLIMMFMMGRMGRKNGNGGKTSKKRTKTQEARGLEHKGAQNEIA